MFELQIAIASIALTRRTVKRVKLEPGMQLRSSSVLFCGHFRSEILDSEHKCAGMIHKRGKSHKCRTVIRMKRGRRAARQCVTRTKMVFLEWGRFDLLQKSPCDRALQVTMRDHTKYSLTFLTYL